METPPMDQPKPAQSPTVLIESFGKLLEPAIMKYEDKSYSLQPDIACGWRPRRKVYRQIPLRCSQQPVDAIVKQCSKIPLTDTNAILYMGPRFPSNLGMMKAYCHKEYEQYVKDPMLYGVPKLKRFSFSYSKERETVAIPMGGIRPYLGMNPTAESNELVFDSDFECGNLDIVIKISEGEYDLFMRVDTNTRGHNSWFFFKVRNTRQGKTVKFNICNFHRTSSLFSTGMKPSVYSKMNSKGWSQEGSNVSYRRTPLRYAVSEGREMWCLSFQYRFESNFDEVYFAYSPPFSYSYLLHTLEERASAPQNKRIMNIQYNLESPGGITIPVVTITSEYNEENAKSKQIIIVTGRLHPGQTQGSWALQGFMDYLLSDSAKPLRNSVIFKIIPLVNVDGVVAGNFRTGLLGFDLNRLFHLPDADRYHQIELIKEFAYMSRQKTLMYLDFHGHSTKKNIFIYGPDYGLVDPKYMLCRVFPKLVSKLTNTFRYYSCIFKISREKAKTARAVMLREFGIPYCYTVEASAYCYNGQFGDLPFVSQTYVEAGKRICEGVQKFTSILLKLEVKKEQIKKEKKRIKEMKIEMYKEVRMVKMRQRSKGKKHKESVSRTLQPKPLPSYSSIEGLDDLIEQIKRQEGEMDKFDSDDDSDCERLSDDYPQTDPLPEKKNVRKSKKPGFHSEMSASIHPNNIREEQQSLSNASQLPRNQRVVIRDLIEESEMENRKLLYNRLKRFEKAHEESMAEINSGRIQRSVVYGRLGSRATNKQLEDKQWGSIPPRQKLTHVSKLKMHTINSKHQLDSLEELESKIVVRQGCIVNLRIDSESDEKEEISSSAVDSHKQSSKLPEISMSGQKQQTKSPSSILKQGRKLEIIEQKYPPQSQIPEMIADILRRHMVSKERKERRLNRSIQIIRF